jgi:hypothetical protein
MILEENRGKGKREWRWEGIPDFCCTSTATPAYPLEANALRTCELIYVYKLVGEEGEGKCISKRPEKG